MTLRSLCSKGEGAPEDINMPDKAERTDDAEITSKKQKLSPVKAITAEFREHWA
jgi:hypothetical protein